MKWRRVSDEELLALYRAERGSGRERDCILELLRRYHPAIAYWCLRATGDPEAAERLALQILDDVHRQLDSWTGEGRFAVWLFRVAARRCTRDMRRRLLLDPEGRRNQ